MENAVTEDKEKKRELAKLKRQASDIASRIHDIVEDTLWSEYKELEPLSQQIVQAVENYYSFKKEHNL